MYSANLYPFQESFYATKEERRKNAKREYEKQMAERAHLQGLSHRIHRIMTYRLTFHN